MAPEPTDSWTRYRSGDVFVRGYLTPFSCQFPEPTGSRHHFLASLGGPSRLVVKCGIVLEMFSWDVTSHPSFASLGGARAGWFSTAVLFWRCFHEMLPNTLLLPIQLVPEPTGSRMRYCSKDAFMRCYFTLFSCQFRWRLSQLVLERGIVLEMLSWNVTSHLSFARLGGARPDFAVPELCRFLVRECARFGSRLPTVFFGFISSIFNPGLYKILLPIADVSPCLDFVDFHYESMLNLAPNCRLGGNDNGRWY